jgi:hypothetical protein
MLRPTAILKTSPESTRVLVRSGDDEVLKARLPSLSSPHRLALPMLLEAMALWHQAPVHAVLSAPEPESWFRLGLVDGLCVGLDSIHYTIELREPGRSRRRRRIDGLGSFVDLRQLELRGVR